MYNSAIEIGSNPTVLGVIYALGGAILTFLGIWIKSKLESKTTIEIAQINKSEKSVEYIKKELKIALDQISEIEKERAELREDLSSHKSMIQHYKYLLQHFKVLVGILTRQLPEDIRNNPANQYLMTQIERSIEDIN